MSSIEVLPPSMIAFGGNGVGYPEVRVRKSQEQAEPADLDDDGFSVQIPASYIGWRQRCQSSTFQVSGSGLF